VFGSKDRALLSAWNPSDPADVALAPCHVYSQFSVTQSELSCRMHQRTGDLGFGTPINIACHSLLTCMMAQVCGLKPGELFHTPGKFYLCENQLEAIKA